MTPGPLMLIALLGAHWFLDYAGQGDFMARAKNPKTPIPGVPFGIVLSAHAGIHASAVALITGIWWLFACEYLFHYAADKLKCEDEITFEQDQAVHIVCKVLWLGIAWWLA